MKRWRAFTVVELLVVTAIVSVLAAFLLPVLQKARTAAVSIHCMNNLKQIATWAKMYADESSGVLPSNGPRLPHISSTFWMQKCPDYDNKAQGGTVFHCPQASTSVQPRWEYQFRWSFDYGLNSYLGGRGDSWAPQMPRAHLLTAKKYWFSDGTMHGSPYYCYEYVSAEPGSNYRPWIWLYPQLPGHPNQASNFAFGDGHVAARLEAWVRSLPKEELEQWRGTKTD